MNPEETRGGEGPGDWKIGPKPVKHDWTAECGIPGPHFHEPVSTQAEQMWQYIKEKYGTPGDSTE